jgi:hypothetical protein
MLHWICPDCGNDCSPTVRECPACADTPVTVVPSSEEVVTEGLLALAHSTQPSSDPPHLQSAPQQLLLATRNGSTTTNGHSNGRMLAIAQTEGEVRIPGDETIESLVRPLVESAQATSVVEPAADAESLIEACVEAVALAVEVAVAEKAKEAAPIVEPSPVEAVSDSAQKSPPVETLEAALVVEPPVEAVSAASQNSPAVETLEAAPVVEPSPVEAVSAAVQNAPAVETLEAAPVVEPPPVEAVSAVETLEAAPVVEPPPVETVSDSAQNSPAVETLDATPVVEPPPVEAVSAAVQNAPAVETQEAAPVVEPPPVEAVSSALQNAPALETLEAAPVVEPPVEAVSASVQNTPAVETLEVALVVEPLSEVISAPLQEAPAVAASLTQPTYDPGPLCHAFELHAEAVLHAMDSQIEVFQSAIRAIAASFAAQPVTALLAAPSEIVIAPAQPATQWMRTSKPSIPSARPCDPNSSSLSAGPLTSALAGPCLPTELRTLIEQKSTKSPHPSKPITIPSWFLSVLIAIALFLGVGSLLQYFSENRDTKATPVASQQPVQASTASAATAVVDAHPLARFVEITGLRVSADLNHKSQLQYLVVNHSSARLSDVLLKISVRSTSDSPGAPALFTLSVIVPSLGPNQSKEIKTDLDAALRSTAIPDWDNLRADVQVGTKQ